LSSDDHYIQITVEIGPIEPPHGLHTFEGDNPVNTVHGELVQRIFSAVLEVDHSAGLSARVVTAASLGYEPTSDQP
jgi:hypothetical protein